jgi:hypothetical protein
MLERHGSRRVVPIEFWHRLVIEGPPEAVARFLDRVQSGQMDQFRGKPLGLDLEAYVPIPPELEPPDVVQWITENWGTQQPMFAQIIERDHGRVVFLLVTAAGVLIPCYRESRR